jgi:hypothetical protein
MESTQPKSKRYTALGIFAEVRFSWEGHHKNGIASKKNAGGDARATL